MPFNPEPELLDVMSHFAVTESRLLGIGGEACVFGGVPIVGDAQLDPLSAVAYLTPEITPAATPRDRSVAREWLEAYGLSHLLEPATRWLAARWSFARDDVRLHDWCRSVLLATGSS